MMKNFGIYGMMAVLLIVSAAALTIESPEQKVYLANSSPLSIPLVITSNITFDNISYHINNESDVIACQNCSNVNIPLVFSEGNYTLITKGILGNYSLESNVSFSIQSNETPNNETNVTDFSLMVINPVNMTYNDEHVALDILSNMTLDKIIYRLDEGNDTLACENCNQYSTTLTVTKGSHTVDVKGILGLIQKEVTLNFYVEFKVNETNGTPENETPENATTPNNKTGQPRFSLGFNKLPKTLMNGKINDTELAQIILSNNLNPGVINRLIKTGMLGNASIQAIIDTQFNPPGIFNKLMDLIGFKHKSYAELIYDNYNVSEKIQQKLLTRDDLSMKYSDEIKNNFHKKLEQKLIENTTIENTADSGAGNKSVIKPYKAGKQNGVHPTKDSTEEGPKPSATINKTPKESKENESDKSNGSEKSDGGKSSSKGGKSGGSNSGGSGNGAHGSNSEKGNGGGSGNGAHDSNSEKGNGGGSGNGAHGSNGEKGDGGGNSGSQGKDRK